MQKRLKLLELLDFRLLLWYTFLRKKRKRQKAGIL